MQIPALAALLLVGNSVSGTVSVIEPETLQPLGTVNVIPDLDERLAEIRKDPLRKLLYGMIRNGQRLEQFEPSDGDRFLDDVFASPDGTRLYVSRSNLGDVAAFDLSTPGFPLLWRTPVAMFKADHAAVSPDGSRIVVSASLASKAQILETATGKIVGSFKTGDFPHQNDYSSDGKLIYNASIGNLQLPHALNFLKGKRQIRVIDAGTLKTVRTYSFDFGVRPSVITPDGKTLFAQLSYLNGLVQMDLESGKIVRTSEQPFSAHAQKYYPKPDSYPHNSAHHGLALSGDGAKLCDAGTIDDTISIVSTADLSVRSTIPTGSIPYWATTSEDGKRCFVSLSGENAVSVIDFDTETEIARVPTGVFPQRSRLARLSSTTLALLASAGLEKTGKPGLPDRSGAPLYPASLLETVAALDLPPGNVTVSPEGRVFITFFPGASPPVKVAELVDGKAVPYPNQEFQEKGELRFRTVLSIRTDRQNRLWTLDAATYGLGTPRLVAFDLATGQVLFHHDFPRDVAPLGSFLNDFVITADGSTIFITDTSNLGHKPALLIHDVATGATRRVLENDPSTRDGDYDVFVDGKRMRMFGLLPLHFGVDGIAMDAEERWIYINVLNSGNLHRVAVSDLLDPTLPANVLSARVEKVADITINDGLLVDRDGSVLITDPEHYALNRVKPGGQLETLFKDPMLRWPDGLSHAPDGSIYLSCSSLQDVFPLPMTSAIKRKGPYFVFRFRLP